MKLKFAFRRLAFTLLSSLSIGCAANAQTPFWLGADISGTTEQEAHGVFSQNKEGVVTENTKLMKELGLNAVRLRVWVDPKDGFCSPEDVLVMARRARDLGMEIMIDFHYSDWWADPGKQNPPAAWKDLSYEQTKEALAKHTRSTLQLLKDDGIDVKWVQIGNETTNGFLWPMGRIEDNFEQYAGLTTAGYEAAKEVYPDAQMMVHLDNGYSRELYEYVFDNLKKYGTPWDAIGISVYPYWSKRDALAETSVTDIIDNIKYIGKRYGCDVMIVEVGVEAAKPEIGKKYLSRLINAAMDTNGACTGVFYWAPEAGDEGHYPLGAFHDRKPTAIMDAYTDAARRLENTTVIK